MLQTVRHEVWERIRAERDRQDRKWGWLGTPGSIMPEGSREERLAVLAEEFGEVSKDVNKIRHGETDDKTGDPVTRDDLHQELIEVAAVCLAWVEADLEYEQSYTWADVPTGFLVHGSGRVVSRDSDRGNGRVYIKFDRTGCPGSIPFEAPAWKPGCNEWTDGKDPDGPVPIFLNPKTGALIYARGTRPPKLFM